MLGKLMPDFFPKIFGPAQDQPLDAERCARASTTLAQRSRRRAAEDIADGFLQIAVANMANAIKKISVQRGYDVTRYALNCFGGAGGQHACLVADALGMTRVLIHPFSSLLSAYGMGLADIRATRQQAIEAPFGDEALATVLARRQPARREAAREVAGQGVAEADVTVEVRAHIRYAGTDTALVVPAYTRRRRVDEPVAPPTLAAMQARPSRRRIARGSASSTEQGAGGRGRSRSRRSAAARNSPSRS